VSFLAFFIALGVFFIICLSIPLEFRVTYRRLKQDDSVIIHLAGFFGLFKYKIDIPMMDWRWALPPHLRLETVVQPNSGATHEIEEEIKAGKVRFPNVLRSFFKLVVRALEIRRWFYRGIHCKHLRWIMEVGFNDAAFTGIAVGGLWGFMGYYIGKLHDNITFQVAKPQIAVYPSFNQSLFRVDFDCIFTLKIGHIIIAGFKVLKIVKVVLRG
jgi:hypothetical protein